MLADESPVATDSPYWNPKTETLDRERIEAFSPTRMRAAEIFEALYTSLAPASQRQFDAVAVR